MKSAFFRRRILPLLLIFPLCGCSAEPAPQQRGLFVMDTYFSATDYGGNDPSALDAVFSLVQEYERAFSVTDPESDVSRVNRADGAPTEVGEETAALIAETLSVSARTGGAIDPTVYPITAEWGFTKGEYQIPDEERINELLPLVDYRAVGLDGRTVTLPAGVQIDFGASAKGFALKGAKRALKEKGVTSVILNLGGNIQTVGTKLDGSLWRTAIAAPDGSGENACILELGECSLATSGNYERYFIGEDGERYCHILDPASGRPVKNGLASATVIGEDAALCDALSTALFVMGAERAEEFWRESGEFEMVLIGEDGTIRYTEGLAQSFRLTEAYSGAKTEVLRK